MTRTSRPSTGGIILRSLTALALLVALYVVQSESYLLFHSLVEVFSVAVAAALFMLAWNSRHFVDSHFLLWIGIGYLFVGIIDLLHTLSYSGMGVFLEAGVNLPTQLWVAARSMQALVLLTAPLFFQRRLRGRLAFGGFAAVTTVVLLAIFSWNIFPTMWSDAAGGLTLAKIISEYVICALLLAATVWILAWRDRLDTAVLALLIGSIAATLAAELSFTLYTDPYGFANLLGHFLKLIAFYLIYKAVVETGLQRPYEVLFRDLKQHEEQLERSDQQLRALNETLEERVMERTAQARALARQLAEAESHERERLAGVVHDDLQQTLAAARMRVQMAAASPEAADEALKVADEQLRQAIQRCRCLAVEVSPGVVRREGLGPALHWLGDHMKHQYGLTVDVRTDDDIGVDDPDMAAMVFRIVRELLFNVTKHAGVEKATVTATTTGDGMLSITVSDEGSGFDPEEALAHPGESFGLGSVLNRVEMLGGKCFIESRPGGGTEVRCVIPAEAN